MDDESDARDWLAELETPGRPRINDIILIGRMLRRKQPAFAIGYLANVQRRLSAFLGERKVAYVSGGRDTALQLLTMLVCRKQRVPYVTPSVIRLLREAFGFCPSYDDSGMLPVREVDGKKDDAQAKEFLPRIPVP